MGSYCDEHEWRHATEPCPTCAKRDAVYDAAMALYNDAGVESNLTRLDYITIQVTRDVFNEFRAVCRKAEEVERG